MAVHLLARLGQRLLSALLWFLLLALAGACLVVAGVYLLAGLGWGLVAGGVLCLVAASFIRRGMTDG